MAEKYATVLIEDAKLIYKNFSGEVSQFNRDGVSEFSVLLDPETATAMTEDGWNVKWLKPREDEDEDGPRQAYLPVAVSYKIRPPKIVLITSRGRSTLDRDEIGMLDWADIITVDLIVNASHWEVGEKSGVKAYLQSMFVTIEEDPHRERLEAKYAELDKAR